MVERSQNPRRGPHPDANPGGQRRDRMVQEARKDPYRDRKQPSGPAVCPECGAAFSAGRWAWVEQPLAAAEVLCPACERIRDAFPAGSLSVGGEFLSDHRDEILGLIRNEADAERQDHPLNRLMAMEEREDGGYEITTTDIHLPRRIGEALHRAYEGELDFEYGDGERSIRVSWGR